MIVIDLEWNSGLYTKLRLDEILQIGAVKVDLSTRKIVDSFNAYIRPKAHKRYSPAAAQLPDLALSQQSELDFPSAFFLFLEWCGRDSLFASWGNSDLKVLRQNRTFHHLGVSLPHTFIDLQLAFDRLLGCGNNLALDRAADYCRVPDVFDPHNALYDALCAWLVVADHVPTPLLLEATRDVGAPLSKPAKAPSAAGEKAAPSKKRRRPRRRRKRSANTPGASPS